MPVKRSRQAHSTCCCNFNARFFFRLSGVQYLVSPSSGHPMWAICARI